MPSLLLCDETIPTALLGRQLGLDDDQIRDRFGKVPRWVQADTPYLLGCEHDWGEQDLCAMLEPQGPMLTRMCLDYGPRTTLALADMREELKRIGDHARTAAGAGAELFDKRMGRFLKAVDEYQDAMLEYHRAHHGAPYSREFRAAAPARLRDSGARLNREFAHELSAVSRQLTPRFRKLSLAEARVPETIRYTPKATKLDIASRIDATRLMDMARNSKRLSRVLILLDVGLRADKVHEVYEAGGNWLREAFVQAGGYYGSVVGTWAMGSATIVTVGVVITKTGSLPAAIAVGSAGVTAVMSAADIGNAIGEFGGAGLYDIGSSIYQAGSQAYDSLSGSAGAAP